MSRIDLSDPGIAGKVAGLYARREYGRELSPAQAHALHPTLMLGYGAFELATERAHRVDKRLKDLGVIKAAAMVGCEWCMDFGSYVGPKAGITEEQLRDVPEFEESAAFSDVEKLVLRLAQGMTRTPAEVADDLWAALREHFDEAQLVELCSVIAIESYRSRFITALALPAQRFSEGTYCVRPEAPMASTGEQSNGQPVTTP